MARTGFEEKKVRNIVYRLFQQGKIKRVGRGLYAGVK
jgi:predicted transcriptional regulator of viral defense system